MEGKFVNVKFWKVLGIITSEAHQEWLSPSPFLPVFNFHEVHESGAINAQPGEIIAAVAALDIRNDRVTNVLLSIRELPSRLSEIFGKRARQNVAPFGFDTFTLLQHTDHEISLGLAGRFWRPRLDICHIPSAREFEALSDPRIAKLVLRFQVIAHPDGIHTLRTETFVYCGNTRIKMLFTPYWLAIRLASGFIRRRTLTSIQRALAMRTSKEATYEQD